MSLSYEAFLKPMLIKADSRATPILGSFELTSRCTLSCKMCYIHRDRNDSSVKPLEKSADWWVDIARQARDRGLLLLLLTGGEPMLHPDFEDIYLRCRELGLLVSVNTNATLINQSRVDFFKKYPPHRLNITLYGLSEKTYSALCGNGEAYNKVTWAIDSLIEAGVNVKLNYSITPENVDKCEGARQYAEEKGLLIQYVSYMFPPVRACGEAHRLSPEDAAKADFLWKKSEKGENFRAFLLNKDMPPTVEDFSECDTCGERIKCRAGLSSFWVTFDGKLTPCGMMTNPSFDLGDFSVGWEYIKSQREGIVLPGKCKGCSLSRVCDVCAAVTVAETGSFDGVPDYACQKAVEFQRLSLEYLNNG